jgi:DNA-binding GntR family transcriptional regulator
LIATQRQLYDQSRRFRLAALREQQINFEWTTEIHKQLVDAIMARDAETALDCLHQDIQGNLSHADSMRNPLSQ